MRVILCMSCNAGFRLDTFRHLFVYENRTLTSLFKIGNASDNSLDLKPTHQAIQWRSEESICTWAPFCSHQASPIVLFCHLQSDLTVISETNSLVCFHNTAPLRTVLSWQLLIILRGVGGLSSCPHMKMLSEQCQLWLEPRSSEWWIIVYRSLFTMSRRGHTIDVSWAVVQRSQGPIWKHRKSDLTSSIYLSLGFLDGGDRAMLLDSRSHLSSPSPKLHDRPTLASSDTSESSLGSHDSDPACLATCSVPTTSLLVTNLPTLLFSQAQDLHPLFFPFGHIEKLEIVQVSPLGTMSVVVQYSAAHVAQEAKETLNGQLYGSYQIEARYVIPIGPNHFDLSTSGLMAVDRKTDCAVSTPGDFLGQPQAALDDHAGRCDTVKGLTLSSQHGFATGSFFNRNSLAVSPPRQSPLPALPSAFPGNFQDYDSSRLSSVDFRFVYFVHILLLPMHLIPRRWSTDDRYGLQLHQHQFALPNQMHYNAVYQSSAAWVFSRTWWQTHLLKCFDNIRLPCFGDPPFPVLSHHVSSIQCYFLIFIPRLLAGYRFVLPGCYIRLEGGLSVKIGR